MKKNKDAGQSGVSVECSHTKMVAIEELKLNPRNAHVHPPEQIKLLANIIAKAGWRSPVVVSKRSGFVVKGHGRLAAAKLLGLIRVPVDIQDYASDEEELADLVADNRIAELAEWDRAVLKDILQELDTGAFDMLITGFDQSAIEAMMTAMPPEILPEELPKSTMEGDTEETGRIIIVFADDDERIRLGQRLGFDITKIVYTAAELLTKND